MCLSHGMFNRIWLKKRDTTQPTAVPPGHFDGALYHDDAPRDFDPQIAMPAGDGFRYPVPDKAVKSAPRLCETDPFRTCTSVGYEIQPYIYTKL